MTIVHLISLQTGFFSTCQLTTLKTLVNPVVIDHIMSSLGRGGGCKKGEYNGNG
jgi:hypothetical protein